MEEINRVIAEILALYPQADADLKDLLFRVLCKYDITPKKDELIVSCHEWERDLKQFLERKAVSGCTDKTIKQYAYVMMRVLASINKPTDEICEADLYGFLKNYQRMNEVSVCTLSNFARIIKAYFGWMYAKEIIRHNPASGLEPFREEKKLRKAFTDVEIEKMKRVCSNKRDIALIMLLLTTGMRISECQQLDVSCVNYNRRSIVVYGKGKKERETFLSDVALMYLHAYIQSRNDTNQALFVGLKEPHERLSVSAMQSAVNHIGKVCGVKAHPHKFRRTLATHLSENGMPIEEIQSILGHANINTTMRYVDISSDRIMNAYQKYA